MHARRAFEYVGDDNDRDELYLGGTDEHRIATLERDEPGVRTVGLTDITHLTDDELLYRLGLGERAAEEERLARDRWDEEGGR